MLKLCEIISASYFSNQSNNIQTVCVCVVSHRFSSLRMLNVSQSHNYFIGQPILFILLDCSL